MDEIENGEERNIYTLDLSTTVSGFLEDTEIDELVAGVDENLRCFYVEKKIMAMIYYTIIFN